MIKVITTDGDEMWIDEYAILAMLRKEPKKMMSTLIDPNAFEPFTILYFEKGLQFAVKDTPEDINAKSEAKFN